ncbi:MAG: hypothetical protein NT027_08440 [Proteobacteria bacterium]|nr:hypothetical protein [Pseudomonadota bacterium]
MDHPVHPKNSVSALAALSNEACHELFLRRCTGQILETQSLLKNYPLDALTTLYRSSTTNELWIACLLCLHASILRRERAYKESNSILDEISSKNDKYFQVGFQKGLNYFDQGQFIDALQEFRRSQSLTDCHEYRLLIDSNIIFCLEFLGMNIDVQLETLWNKFQPLITSNHLPQTSDQICAMKLRLMFRRGQINEMRQYKSLIHPSWAQSSYFLAWALSLPHLSVPSDICTVKSIIEDISLLSNESYLIKSDIQTLMGIQPKSFDPSDYIRPSELIERLYLWTWKWLENPNALQMENLVTLLDFISKPTFSTSMSADDALLYSISLNILSLFDRRFQDLAGKKFSHAALATMNLESLHHEDLFIDELKRLAFNQDLNEQNFLTACANSSSFASQFLKSLSKIEGHPFHQFLQCQQSKDAIEKSLREFSIVIRLQSHEIYVSSNGSTQKIVSMPASKLLAALLKGESIDLNSIARNCFNFRKFDEDRHGSRLSKLLTLINQNSQDLLRLSRKGDRVYLSHPSIRFKIFETPALQFQSEATLNSRFSQITQSLHDGDPLTEKYDLSSDQNLKDPPQIILPGKLVPRSVLEKFFKTGKTQTVQKINQLISKGKIQRIGLGKSARYLIVDTGNQDKPFYLS